MSDLLTALANDLKLDEGWRPFAYQDNTPEQFWTIGYGFLVDQRKGVGLPREVGDAWLSFAIEARWNELIARAPWILEQPEPVQRALGNMAYQIGVTGLLEFINMLAWLKAGNRVAAAAHGLDSRWAKQTPNRAQRVMGLLRG